MFKKLIKCVAAVLVFILAFNCVQDILVGVEDDRTPKRINGFYDNAEGTLDAVFLGSSATYTFLVAPYVWHEYGITIYPYASQAQPIQAARFLIEEARKTQPDAVFIVNVSAINGNVTKEWLHVLFDNMPHSLTKLKAIDYICGSYGYTFEEKLEYIYPMIKYHERWSSLTEADFEMLPDEYKTGNYYYSFLKLKKDVGGIGTLDGDPSAVMPDYIDKAIDDLITYIQKENVKVMFVVTPQSIVEEEKAGVLRSAIEKIEGYGYDVLDMREEHEAVGIDFAVDFYNRGHTNMHGAIKTSAYVANHLIDNFGVEDKRGDATYSDWDIAAEKYYKDHFVDNLIESDMKYINTDLSKYEKD